MEYKLEKNNSKKIVLIISSIIFFMLILIFGGTYSFFSQGDSNTLDDLATENINNTLKYTDNSDYMRDNLIPVVREDVDKFAMKNSKNGYTDNDICKYTDEFNACSLYEFTIENTANVTQKINATLTPNPNGFANLYYMIYEGEQESLDSQSEVIKEGTYIAANNTSDMFHEVILKAKESKTYTVVFYIVSTDYDQTESDGGKTFGAIITIDSVTTGYTISQSYGTTCYDMEKIYVGEYKNTFKLTKFKGINHETGEIIEECGVTQDETTGYYSVTIPSKIGEYKISTLGNRLFTGVSISIKEEGPVISVTEYSKINNITMEEGIEVIEDMFIDYSSESNPEEIYGTFMGIGVDKEPDSDEEMPVFHDVSLKLPNSLKYIGCLAFAIGGIKELTIPSNVEIIGFFAFASNSELTKLTFGTGDDSKLKYIGDSAFVGAPITSMEIPASVESIGDSAFSGNYSLTNLIFKTDSEGKSNLKTIGSWSFFGTSITSLEIPASVETIGESAFNESENLLNLIFKTDSEGNSSLNTIRDNAFFGSSITSLEIPASVEIIGERAFCNNKNLVYLTFKTEQNGNSNLKNIGDSAFLESSINSVEFPFSVETIGEKAFYHYNSDIDNKIESIIFKEDSQGNSRLKTIGLEAFGSTVITSLEIPSSVEIIGENAFSGNSFLTNLIFKTDSEGNSSLNTIRDHAFGGSSITSLEIPTSVETIGTAAFSGSSFLTNLIFKTDSEGKSNLKIIGEQAFEGSSIITLDVPFNVEVIDDHAFAWSYSLTSLTFKTDGEGNSMLKKIGSHAFAGSNLTYAEGNPLIIPSSVTYIGDNAFGSTDNLKQIKYSGNTEGFGSSWNWNAVVIP